MTFTYDLSTNGCLILKVDSMERSAIADLIAEKGATDRAECEALESLIGNSELDWVDPCEIAALTSAPILGIRGEDGEVLAAWGFMDYAVRSFLDDLIQTGQAVFTS